MVIKIVLLLLMSSTRDHFAKNVLIRKRKRGKKCIQLEELPMHNFSDFVLSPSTQWARLSLKLQNLKEKKALRIRSTNDKDTQYVTLSTIIDEVQRKNPKLK